MTPKLQVALDLINLDRAVKIGRDALKGGADIIEIGTPLIKSEGMDAVRRMKEIFPGTVLVADMKTMDVGGLEVEIAAKAGADIVCILGSADDETFKEGLRAGRNYDAKILGDLIGVDDPASRAEELCQLGVDYVGVHVAIDAQMRGEDPLAILREVVKASSVPVAVAGGITSELVPGLVKAGADIIIVGGAIIKARDVVSAASDIKKTMLEGVSTGSQVSRKFGPEKVREALSRVSTANVSDAMHREPCMQGIGQLTCTGARMVGRAFTVRTVDGDWAKPVEAIEKAEAGDVLVVDAGGGTTAVWGELASWSCKTKGIQGIVIDGAVRDVDEIRELGFPVFARHCASNASDPKGYGGMSIEVNCGQRRVRPGDWILGDDSGVMVIPKEEAIQIANRALDVMEKEERIREEIKEGRTLSVVMELEKWELRD